jgi:hypothetical protein
MTTSVTSTGTGGTMSGMTGIAFSSSATLFLSLALTGGSFLFER